MSEKSRWTIGLAAATALAWACGGEDPVPSGRPMAAAVPATQGDENRAPRIDRVEITPREPTPGLPLQAVVEASDPDGDAVRLSYSWLHGGKVVEGANNRPAVNLRGVKKGDRIEVEVVATDGLAASEATRASVTFRNRAPVVTGMVLEPSGVVERGSEIRVLPEAYDPDEDPIRFRFSWFLNGEETGRRDERFSTRGLRRGDEVRVQVVASDGDQSSEPVESPIVQIGNAPPEIVSVPPTEWIEGEFRYSLEARDPDGDRRLRYRLVSGPEGMTVDPMLGTVHWKPQPDQVGSHRIEVAVEDSVGSITGQQFDLTVRESEPAPGATPPAAPQQ